MGKTCFLGSHTWNGCKCIKCGKTRDEGHDWTKDCEKCSQCGKIRENAHGWVGCKCYKCGKTRDEGHDWRKDCEKCSRCGKTIENAHAWEGCKCSRCGKTRDEGHDWQGCLCVKCRKTRDDSHDWSQDCEKCTRCGHTRTGAHKYRGCQCTECGKLRDTDHEWEGTLCRICGKIKTDEEVWAEGLVQAGNYHDLADLVGQYNHELNEQDKERRKCARIALLAAGEQAVDAVIETFAKDKGDLWALAEILIASNSKRAALPLLTQFRFFSATPKDVEKMINFFVKMKAVEVMPGLETLLRSDRSSTRMLAAQALGKLEIAETSEVLLKALKGNPDVRSGLEQAGTHFARTILNSFEERRRADGPKVETMSEADMLKIMQNFASAYLRDDNKTRDQLEFTVKDIGEELNRRGGEAAMRKMLQNIQDPASRHIDRVWSGIGSWRG